MIQDHLDILKSRGTMLAEVRSFFKKRHVLEVDTPLLSSGANVDAHIDVISTGNLANNRYLHTSPEYCMKRLLAMGIGDIYQMSHVFRKDESGHKHNPEFTLIEWYRLGFSLNELAQETCDLIECFISSQDREVLSYQQAFQKYVGIDPFTCSDTELKKILTSIGYTDKPETKDDALNLILGSLIEPKLGNDGLTILTEYPASQAALAMCKLVDGNDVALRFEVYFKGYELANGYQELADANVMRKRFQEENNKRQELNKEALPIDEFFLNSLEQMPPCSGVAVGFDRLMMLKHNKQSIEDVLPFAWDEV